MLMPLVSVAKMASVLLPSWQQYISFLRFQTGLETKNVTWTLLDGGQAQHELHSKSQPWQVNGFQSVSPDQQEPLEGGY